MPEDPTAFFRERGFELTFSRHSDEELAAIYAETTVGVSREVRKSVTRALADGRIGPVFADLHAPNGQVLQDMGRVPTRRPQPLEPFSGGSKSREPDPRHDDMCGRNGPLPPKSTTSTLAQNQR